MRRYPEWQDSTMQRLRSHKRDREPDLRSEEVMLIGKLLDFIEAEAFKIDAPNSHVPKIVQAVNDAKCLLRMLR